MMTGLVDRYYDKKEHAMLAMLKFKVLSLFHKDHVHYISHWHCMFRVDNISNFH